jgi:hypothetical protein
MPWRGLPRSSTYEVPFIRAKATSADINNPSASASPVLLGCLQAVCILTPLFQAGPSRPTRLGNKGVMQNHREALEER